MGFCLRGALQPVRPTRTCYNRNPENCGHHGTGRHGLRGGDESGGWGRARAQNMVYLCVIVLQPGAEESARLGKQGELGS